MYDLEMSNHGSIFKTTAFKRLTSAVPMSCSTFAMCKFNGKSQKYTTIYYTNDAASVLDQLDLPQYKCDHEGKHEQVAGGKLPDGTWASKDTAYPDQFHVRLAMAFTAARTGSPKPIQAPPTAIEQEKIDRASAAASSAAKTARLRPAIKPRRTKLAPPRRGLASRRRRRLACQRRPRPSPFQASTHRRPRPRT